MKKLEAKETTKINKWFSKVVKTSSPWEIKHTRGALSFDVSEIADHQINWLLAATTEGGCTWKIPDAGFGYNPFDTMHYKKTDAYIIICFPTMVYAIEIRVLLATKLQSLPEAKANSISWFKAKLQDL
jgi:hypothetical protein